MDKFIENGMTVSQVKDKLTEASTGNDAKELNVRQVSFDIDVFGDSSYLKVTFPQGETYYACENAEKDLCKITGIPFGYYKKISDDLKLRNLRTRIMHIDKEMKFRLNDEFDLVRGVIQTKYEDFDNHQVFSLLEESGYGDYPVYPFVTMDDKEDVLINKQLQFRILLNELSSEPQAGNYAGLHLNISELGSALITAPLIYRIVCDNGLIALSKDQVKAYSISYKKIEPDIITGLMRSMLDQWNSRFKKIDDKVGELVEKKISDEEMSDFFSHLQDNRIPQSFMKDVRDSLEGREYTWWEVVNLTTNMAQSLPESRKFTVEREASNYTGITELMYE